MYSEEICSKTFTLTGDTTGVSSNIVHYEEKCCDDKNCPHNIRPSFDKPVWVTCTCPTMLYIPPGQHFHHNCPLHGEVVLHGSYSWC